MIIRRRAAGLLAITQPDHAHLAGVFAEAWGAGPAVDPAGVRKPLLTAARDHDDGWLAWEREPTIDERGRPHDFLTIPMDQRVAIYRRGITLVCAGDLYAGLLTSMHLTRLVAEGLDTAEIAHKLCYSERTVKNALHDVTSRLQLRNRSHAVAYALKQGLI